MEYESVLVIPVPEAEPVVGFFRNKYDPSALDNMPAHITINYPFLFSEENVSEVIESLKELFSKYCAFEYFLVSIGRFPGVLYLEPIPSRPFVELIQAVAERFSHSPPYRGKFKKAVPHLTLAYAKDEETIDGISKHFSLVSKGELPIKAIADQVWLMDNRPGAWTKRVSFALAKNA